MGRIMVVMLRPWCPRGTRPASSPRRGVRVDLFGGPRRPVLPEGTGTRELPAHGAILRVVARTTGGLTTQTRGAARPRPPTEGRRRVSIVLVEVLAVSGRPRAPGGIDRTTRLWSPVEVRRAWLVIRLRERTCGRATSAASSRPLAPTDAFHPKAP